MLFVTAKSLSTVIVDKTHRIINMRNINHWKKDFLVVTEQHLKLELSGARREPALSVQI